MGGRRFEAFCARFLSESNEKIGHKKIFGEDSAPYNLMFWLLTQTQQVRARAGNSNVSVICATNDEYWQSLSKTLP
jgi:hypothetical protein